jgi:hypothetical protein
MHPHIPDRQPLHPLSPFIPPNVLPPDTLPPAELGQSVYPGDERPAAQEQTSMTPPAWAGAESHDVPKPSAQPNRTAVDVPAPAESSEETPPAPPATAIGAVAMGSPDMEADAAPEPIPQPTRTPEEAARIADEWEARLGHLELVPREIIEQAAQYDDADNSRVTALHGRAVLEKIREYRHEHPHVTYESRRRSVTPEHVAEQHVRQLADEWSSELRVRHNGSPIDADAASKHFSKFVMLYMHTNGSLALDETEPVLRATWEVYKADLQEYSRVGIKRPETFATFNDPTELAAYIDNHPRPDAIAKVASFRPSDPFGPIRERAIAGVKIVEQFADHEFLTPRLIDYHIARGTKHAVEHVGRYLERINEVVANYGDIDGAEQLFEHLKIYVEENPVRVAEEFLEKQYEMGQRFADDPDFDEDTIPRLSIRACGKKAPSITTVAAHFKQTLTRLREEIQRREPPVAISDKVLREAAALSKRSDALRLRYAHGLQQMIDDETAEQPG